MKEMINTFIENSENAINNFKKYKKQKNWKQAGETAHKILPSYRHLRVDKVVSNLLSIKEKSWAEKEFESLPGLLDETINEIEKIIQDLRNEYSTDN
jgi:hypothetical protein